MGWWGSVKNSAEKTKLRGDIVLTQRGITARKKKFGEEFYDVLTNDKQRLLGVSTGTLSVFKKGPQCDDLRTAFEEATYEVCGMQAREDELQKNLDVMEVKGSHTMPDETIGQKMSKTGKILSDAGTGTKIHAQMKMVYREIKIRKENFGLEVYDYAQQSDDKEKKGLKGKISKALTNFSEQEKEIQDIIDVAKKDVEVIEVRVKSLERQIAFLDSEMEPLAPTSSSS